MAPENDIIIWGGGKKIAAMNGSQQNPELGKRKALRGKREYLWRARGTVCGEGGSGGWAEVTGAWRTQRGVEARTGAPRGNQNRVKGNIMWVKQWRCTGHDVGERFCRREPRR